MTLSSLRYSDHKVVTGLRIWRKCGKVSSRGKTLAFKKADLSFFRKSLGRMKNGAQET